MAEQDFWSVDKLMPRIRSGFSSPGHASGTPISGLKNEEIPVKKGKIHFLSSRVIRSYQFLAYGSLPEKSEPDLSGEPVWRALQARVKEPLTFLAILSYCTKALEHPKKETLEDLIWLWENYRGDFAVADKFFADLVLDLCLLLSLPIPFERLSPLISSSQLVVKPLLYSLFIFDYLFSADHELSGEETELILSSLTRMNFRHSKAYRSDPGFAALFENVLREAFREGLVQKEELNEALFNIQIPSEVKTVRRIFPQLQPRREGEIRISLITLPLLYDENVRERMDGIVRYVENRVRGILGIKNNLSRVAISEAHKAFLDRILFPYEARAVRREEEWQEEKKKVLPAPPRKIRVDVEKAGEIEEISWQITRELTKDLETGGEDYVVLGAGKDEEFDQEYEKDLAARPSPPAGEGEFWEFAAALTPEEEGFVNALLYQGKDAARKYAFSVGQFFEGMVAAVNAKAQDTLDDVICDGTGTVFEEYLSPLKDVFFKGD